MNKKTTGIVASINWIGWIIAFFAGDKEGAKFHLNQALVIFLAGIVCSIIARITIVGAIIGGNSLNKISAAFIHYFVPRNQAIRVSGANIARR